MKLTATCLILSLSLLTACGGPPAERIDNSGAIVGLVTDGDTGQPISGASIGVKDTNRGTNTDSDGFFRITGMQSGSYTIMATAVPYPMKAEAVTDVAHGSTNSLCLELSGRKWQAEAVTQEDGTLVGLVKDSETGEPVIGATVRVEGTNKSTRSDLNGFFKISGFESARYTLVISDITYLATRFEIEITKAHPTKALCHGIDYNDAASLINDIRVE